MADEPDKSGQEPNLELPSLLGFGRKKKRKDTAAPEAPATEELPTADEVPPDAGNDLPADPLGADPVEAPAPPSGAPAGTPPEPPARQRGQRSGLAPAAGTAKRLPPGPPPSTRDQPAVIPGPVSPSGLTPLEVPEREVSSVEDPGLNEPALEGPDTAPGRERSVADSAREETTVLPAAPVPPPPAAPQYVAPLPDPGTTATEAPLGWPAGEAEEAQPEPAPPRARRSPSLRLPVVNPWIAAAVTGALVGFLGVLLAALASRGCESVRGVGSCGGIGLLALLIIVAIQVIVGAALLTASRVFDAFSTSFLGVGLAAAFVLLFLFGSLESGWMFLVIPVVTAATFLVSMWVTTALVDSARSDDLGR